mgnify:CR=1 FL=1
MAAFTVIGHHECTTTDAVVTFSSIASSYDHLMLLISARSDQSTYVSGMGMKFNSATTNYSETRLIGSTATPISNRKTGESILRAWGNIPGSSVLADTFSSNTVWIPHYANTANFKSFVARSAVPNNSTTDDQWNVMVSAGLWSDTSAISQIDLSIVAGDDFVQYSNFTLYGVTGA